MSYTYITNSVDYVSADTVCVGLTGYVDTCSCSVLTVRDSGSCNSLRGSSVSILNRGSVGYASAYQLSLYMRDNAEILTAMVNTPALDFGDSTDSPSIYCLDITNSEATGAAVNLGRATIDYLTFYNYYGAGALTSGYVSTLRAINANISYLTNPRGSGEFDGVLESVSLLYCSCGAIHGYTIYCGPGCKLNMLSFNRCYIDHLASVETIKGSYQCSAESVCGIVCDVSIYYVMGYCSVSASSVVRKYPALFIGNTGCIQGPDGYIVSHALLADANNCVIANACTLSSCNITDIIKCKTLDISDMPIYNFRRVYTSAITVAPECVLTGYELLDFEGAQTCVVASTDSRGWGCGYYTGYNGAQCSCLIAENTMQDIALNNISGDVMYSCVAESAGIVSAEGCTNISIINNSVSLIRCVNCSVDADLYISGGYISRRSGSVSVPKPSRWWYSTNAICQTVFASIVEFEYGAAPLVYYCTVSAETVVGRISLIEGYPIVADTVTADHIYGNTASVRSVLMASWWNWWGTYAPAIYMYAGSFFFDSGCSVCDAYFAFPAIAPKAVRAHTIATVRGAYAGAYVAKVASGCSVAGQCSTAIDIIDSAYNCCTLTGSILPRSARGCTVHINPKILWSSPFLAACVIVRDPGNYGTIITNTYSDRYSTWYSTTAIWDGSTVADFPHWSWEYSYGWRNYEAVSFEDLVTTRTASWSSPDTTCYYTEIGLPEGLPVGNIFPGIGTSTYPYDRDTYRTYLAGITTSIESYCSEITEGGVTWTSRWDSTWVSTGYGKYPCTSPFDVGWDGVVEPSMWYPGCEDLWTYSSTIFSEALAIGYSTFPCSATHYYGMECVTFDCALPRTAAVWYYGGFHGVRVVTLSNWRSYASYFAGCVPASYVLLATSTLSGDIRVNSMADYVSFEAYQSNIGVYINGANTVDLRVPNGTVTIGSLVEVRGVTAKCCILYYIQLPQTAYSVIPTVAHYGIIPADITVHTDMGNGTGAYHEVFDNYCNFIVSGTLGKVKPYILGNAIHGSVVNIEAATVSYSSIHLWDAWGYTSVFYFLADTVMCSTITGSADTVRISTLLDLNGNPNSMVFTGARGLCDWSIPYADVRGSMFISSNCSIGTITMGTSASVYVLSGAHIGTVLYPQSGEFLYRSYDFTCTTATTCSTYTSCTTLPTATICNTYSTCSPACIDI